MSKYLILHGTSASPASNWFMWLKGALIGQGHDVWLPQLPDCDQPNAVTYTDFLLANPDFVIDQDTTLVGHSSGAVEILHLLQHLQAGVPVKSAVLVSAFENNLGMNNLNGLFDEPLDYDVIKAACDSFTFVHSDDDPYVPLEQAEHLAEQTDGELLVFEGQGHFNTELDPRYKRFPELLEFL